jgi:two-component system, chemotaxis family, sensor histidine kinase and response regulator WspE
MSGFSLYNLFLDELRRICDELKALLLQLNKNPDEVAKIEQLGRKLHALKGAARVTNLPLLEKLLVAMEYPSTAFKRGEAVFNTQTTELLLQGLDELTAIGNQAEADVAAWLASRSGLIAQLQSDLQKSARPAAEASEAMSGDRKMLELFAFEAEEQVGALHRGLMLMEVQPDQLGLIAPVMRAAHSIKGAARAVRLERIVALVHTMEDRLSAMQKQSLPVSETAVELLMESADAILLAANSAKSSGKEQNEPQIATLLQKLEALDAPAVQTASVKSSSSEAVAPNNSSSSEALASSKFDSLPMQAEPSAQPISAPMDSSSARASTPDVASSQPSASNVVDAPLEPAIDAGSYIPVESLDAVLKVQASKIGALIGMAGQGVVEARKLRPFAERIQRFRREAVMLSDVLEELHHELGAPPVTDPVGSRINELRKRITETRRTVAGWGEEFGEYARESDNLNQRLYRAASATRMRPFRDVLLSFPRMVRDLAKRLGKKIRFEQSGGHHEVDRDVLDKLEAPLLHLVRNAMDHGIESGVVRKAKGKAEEGTIKVHADLRAGMLVVEVSDNGAGLDAEKIREKIVAKNLLTTKQASTLESQALFNYLFRPGFSTAEQVTEVSGRGVGLDVVREMAQALNGNVKIQSKQGLGCTMILSVPVSRSVTRAIVVVISGEIYAFPVTRVERIVQVNMQQIEISQGRQYVHVNGENVALIDLAQVLELGQALPEQAELSVVVVERQGQHFGMAVDQFVGEFDLSVRPMDARLGRVADLAGASLMPDGEPVLLLDVDDLLQSSARHERYQSIQLSENTSVEKRRKRILVVDDSMSVRELERQLLSGRGFDVSVAVDGQDGWSQVRSQEFDLVVTDVDMPRMDGIQLTRSIKQDPRLRRIPVIIVSYRDRPEDKARGMEVRADSYLTKGDFHDESFISNVVELIGEPLAD